jgi:hypothetical protein
MRLLTSAELQQCAGGTENVTVTASRIYFSWGGGGYNYGGGSEYDASNRGAYQDQTPPTEEDLADAFAYAVQQDILAMSDDKEREYGTLIYRDPTTGEIKALPLVRGETVEEAKLLRGPDAPPMTNFAPQLNQLPQGAKILGVVHNHADVGYDDAADERNKNPSDGDDAFAYFLIRNGYADAENFAHYIIGPKDGELREFDY